MKLLNDSGRVLLIAAMCGVVGCQCPKLTLTEFSESPPSLVARGLPRFTRVPPTAPPEIKIDLSSLKDLRPSSIAGATPPTPPTPERMTPSKFLKSLRKATIRTSEGAVISNGDTVALFGPTKEEMRYITDAYGLLLRRNKVKVLDREYEDKLISEMEALRNSKKPISATNAERDGKNPDEIAKEALKRIGKRIPADYAIFIHPAIDIDSLKAKKEDGGLPPPQTSELPQYIRTEDWAAYARYRDAYLKRINEYEAKVDRYNEARAQLILRYARMYFNADADWERYDRAWDTYNLAYKQYERDHGRALEEAWSQYTSAWSSYATRHQRYVQQYNAQVAAYRMNAGEKCWQEVLVPEMRRRPLKPLGNRRYNSLASDYPKATISTQRKVRRQYRVLEPPVEPTVRQEPTAESKRMQELWRLVTQKVDDQGYTRAGGTSGYRNVRLFDTPEELIVALQPKSRPIKVTYRPYKFAATIRVVDLKSSELVWFGTAEGKSTAYLDAVHLSTHALLKAIKGADAKLPDGVLQNFDD